MEDKVRWKKVDGYEYMVSTIGTVKRYPSVIQASKETGIPSSTIYDCTRGARKKAWGYIWKYAN